MYKRGTVLASPTDTATQGLHPSLLGPPPSGRRSSRTASHYPPECAPGLSLLRNERARRGRGVPSPQLRGSAATTAATGPGWRPIGARTPQELTATAAASRARARKERACAARRGVSSGPACPAPPSGPAHSLGWPRRCLRDWRLGSCKP